MKSVRWYENVNAVDKSLTVTAKGGSATAFLYKDMIEVNFTNTATTASYVVETPIGFEVIDVYTVAKADATGAVVYVYNGASAITNDVGSPGASKIQRTASVDLDVNSFVTDDDDLTISASATSTGAPCKQIVYIKIKPT